MNRYIVQLTVKGKQTGAALSFLVRADSANQAAVFCEYNFGRLGISAKAYCVKELLSAKIGETITFKEGSLIGYGDTPPLLKMADSFMNHGGPWGDRPENDDDELEPGPLPPKEE